MTKPKFSNTCKGCCTGGGTCDCQKCYPKKLCVRVQTSTVGDNVPKCCSFNFTVTCSSPGYWHGTKACDVDGLYSAVDITVEIFHEDYDPASCFTRITCNGTVFDFAGVLPDGMSFSLVASDGTGLAIQIAKPLVVENPLINKACHPCVEYKATCLPQKFCFEVICAGSSSSDAFYSTLTFNCETMSWTGDPVKCGTSEYDATVVLIDDDVQCGVYIFIGQDSYSDVVSDTVLFGGPDEPFFTKTYNVNAVNFEIRSLECGDCPNHCCCYCDTHKLPTSMYVTTEVALEPRDPGSGAVCNNAVSVTNILCANPDIGGVQGDSWSGSTEDVFCMGCDPATQSEYEYVSITTFQLSMCNISSVYPGDSQLSWQIRCERLDGTGGSLTNSGFLMLSDADILDCDGPLIRWVIPGPLNFLSSFCVNSQCQATSTTITVSA